MLKEFVEKLLELKRPEIVEVDNREYSTINLTPILEPQFSTINVSNLDSLIEYLKSDLDEIKDTVKIVNIMSQTKVIVESKEYGNFNQRDVYIQANYESLIPRIDFERFVSIEKFIIDLKSKFEETEQLNQILKLVGNISEENVTKYNDDGITQKVTTKTGIARLEETALPPRIKLKPFRTFIEVNQPESEFLLRVRKGCGELEVALFEADGGAWKIQAIKNIAEYLKENLKDVKNLIILN